jgi:5-methylcytosine-specific restriction endonuclease McrA
LTIAHLDHTPENCAAENLKALCQKCHNKYDAKHRAQTKKRFMYAKQKLLFEE